MVHKNTSLQIIVKHNVKEIADCRSIVFERPQGLDFESGDWIDISFGNEKLNGGRTYSLSSSPTEPDLVITFKDGISEVKKKLASLSPGDKATITQYGNDYKFTLKPHRPSILIAGGVGIAPFRSMLKEMIDMNSNNQVALIYINKSPQFLFEEELSLWMSKLPRARMTKLTTEKLNKKNRVSALLDAIDNIESSFYIAGPEGMVEDTEHLLLDKGVNIKDIKLDSFSGY